MTPLIAVALGSTLAPITFDRLEARVGVDDGAIGRAGEAIFSVLVDGDEAFRTGPMLPGEPAREVSVPLGEATTFVLRIDDEGDGHGGDWGQWLDARLIDDETGAFVFLTDLEPSETAWIPARRDRNIVGDPLSVGGETFLRGWGCISGSTLTFSNWNQQVAELEAELDAQNAAIRSGLVTIRATDMPDGLALGTGGETWSAEQLAEGVRLDLSATLEVTTAIGNAEHAIWWASKNAVVEYGFIDVALIDAVQADPRPIQRSLVPPRSALVEPTRLPRKIWAGAAALERGPIQFELRDLSSRLDRAPKPPKVGEEVFALIEASAIDPPSPWADGTIEVRFDDRPVAWLLASDPDSWQITVPLIDLPDQIELISRPGSSGSVGDGLRVDVEVVAPEGSLGLRSLLPALSDHEDGEPRPLRLTQRWRVPGDGFVRWTNFVERFRGNVSAAERTEAALTAIEAAANPAAVLQAIEPVLEADHDATAVRTAAALKLVELQDLGAAGAQAGRILQSPRASVAELRTAGRIVQGIPRDYDVATVPLPGQPSAVARVAQAERSEPFRLDLDAESGWVDVVEFVVGGRGNLAALIDSRGLELEAAIFVQELEVTTRRGVNPLIELDWRRRNIPEGTVATLRVRMDPDVTEVVSDLRVVGTIWDVGSDQDLPSERWTMSVRRDGSATVRRRSEAPVLAAIPRSATDLRVVDARTEAPVPYALTPAIAQPMGEPNAKLGRRNLCLMAVPKPGQTLAIEYEWPDAAYDVPFSRYDWGRVGHAFLRTPPALVEGRGPSVWRVTDVPSGWTPRVQTPEPSEDGSYRVPAHAGLEIEWVAPDIRTPWIAGSHRNLRLFAPDNPSNRHFFDAWLQAMAGVYDTQVRVTGYEPPHSIYVGVQRASMLSGYGGGTYAADDYSESWVPVDDRLAPGWLATANNPLGVDSHELHWIQFRGFPAEFPAALRDMFGAWIEEIGWRETQRLGSRATYDEFMARDAALDTTELDLAIGLSDEAWAALSGDEKRDWIAWGWRMLEEIETAEPGLVARFLAAQRESQPYVGLDPESKAEAFATGLMSLVGDDDLRAWLSDRLRLTD